MIGFTSTITWIFTCAMVLLALFVSPFVWFLAAPALVWQIGYLLYTRATQWRRVHFPFMRLYAFGAGVTSADAEMCGRTSDAEEALVTTARFLFPLSSGQELAQFVHQSIEDGCRFTLRDDFLRYLSQKKSELSEADIQAMLDRLAEAFANPSNFRRAQFVVLGIILRRHGKREALKYLSAIIEGRAA